MKDKNKQWETDWLYEDEKHFYVYFTLHAAEEILGCQFDEEDEDQIEELKANIIETDGPKWIQFNDVEFEHHFDINVDGVRFPGPVAFQINSAIWVEHRLNKILTKCDHRSGFTGADFSATTWMLGIGDWFIQDDEDGYHVVFERLGEDDIHLDVEPPHRKFRNPAIIDWIERGANVSELINKDGES